ncbi:hypothetical protein [Caulobacter sp. SSI4214]|uniref:hypothetical protein n=1 Tax=Caulobacter sp. SSI4214 TaxID=2575739 RepID=UPI0019D5B752|nr:hypothetical protein [Caulobacter sp. SSI4214]
MILELLLVSSITTSAVEVWTGGDDGLTQRFAGDFRSAVQDVTGRPMKALVDQIKPAAGGRWLTTVVFSRDGQEIYTAKCVKVEREISQCVREAAKASERLTREGR